MEGGREGGRKGGSVGAREGERDGGSVEREEGGNVFSPLLTLLGRLVLTTSRNIFTGSKVLGGVKWSRPFCKASSIHLISFHARSVLS